MGETFLDVIQRFLRAARRPDGLPVDLLDAAGSDLYTDEERRIFYIEYETRQWVIAIRERGLEWRTLDYHDRERVMRFLLRKNEML